MPPKAITVAIVAMGGEGGGVLADWITDMAEDAGFYAQTTSVPGVAQRTGSTIYYLEMFPEAAVRAAGKDPVLALMPVPGELDVVIASELMEAGRAIQRGLVTADRTTLIASTHRVYSMTEKTAIADGRVDSAKLIEGGTAAAKRFVARDFARIAAETGSVISAALFGALAASDALPFTQTQFEDAIRRGGVGIETSLTAFRAGVKAAGEPERREADAAIPKIGPRLRGLAERVNKSFPVASRAVLLAGVQRLADYQDESYASDYLDQLDPIQRVDRDGELLTETARYLALWMSYEDTIRVADLKTRGARFERVHQEVHAQPDQVVQIREFLHPRVEEISDTLPAGLGRWLLQSQWARGLVDRFTSKGKVVETTSIHGFLMLYFIAGLRRFRRGSLRFGIEQKRIAEWLAQVESLAVSDYALAREVAECPQLVKGYGDTHHRGWRNFERVMGAISGLRRTADAAASMKRLREAALADESGRKLDEALREVTA
jgi:indolepyruvate ferredoxin oxidoreductase beta subunit